MMRGIPRRRRCILPPVRWFAQATESQLSGDLHGHYVISLHWFICTSSSFRSALDKNAKFRADVVRCAHQLITMNPALLRTSDKSCPTIGCSGDLESVDIAGEAYKRPLADAGPVPPAQCIQCEKHFSDKDVLDIRIADHLSFYNIQIMPCDVDYAKCAPPSFPFKDNPRSEAIMTFILRDVMMHWWTHCRSCFKSNGTYAESICLPILPSC